MYHKYGLYVMLNNNMNNLPLIMMPWGITCDLLMMPLIIILSSPHTWLIIDIIMPQWSTDYNHWVQHITVIKINNGWTPNTIIQREFKCGKFGTRIYIQYQKILVKIVNLL